MATNNFLAFCPTDIGTNLLTQIQYAAAADRTNGNQPGVASSKLNNKAVRQANVLASQLAQWVCNKSGADMLDDGDLATLLASLTAALAPTTQEYDITNLTLSASVAASALTIAVKTKAGNNASATDPITVGMRSSTLTSGVYLTRSITGALSVVLSSGSTLGQVDAQPSVIYVYLIDNAGTLELAVSHAYYPENARVTTVAEGGAGAADSATAIYSTTQRTNVAIRNIGYILNSQTTAGTWASAGTQIQLTPGQNFIPPTIQNLTSGSGTYITPAGAKYLRVRMVGAGGGGGPSGSTTGTAGQSGGNTTFGTTLLVANGGSGGSAAGGGAHAGGTASLGGAIGIAIPGSQGGGATTAAGSINFFPSGQNGGCSPFGGAGGGGANGGSPVNAGGNGATNSGSGGGGASGPNSSSPSYAGDGGGSGGYVDALLTAPLASYSYAVGAAGVAGVAGTSGAAGGTGGSGVIVVEEYYN